MKRLFSKIFPFKIEFEPWNKRDKALGTFLIAAILFSFSAIYQQSGGKFPVGIGIDAWSLISSINIQLPSLPFFNKEESLVELTKVVDPTVTPKPTFAPLNGIKPASPSAILTIETPMLFRKDIAIKDGWMLPEGHFWHRGFFYQKPISWKWLGESCGPTFSPPEVRDVWISICGPYHNDYSFEDFEKNNLQRDTILEKRTTMINNHPAEFFFLEHQEEVTLSKTYYVDVWDVLTMAGDKTQFAKSGMVINLTATTKELLDTYTPVYDQFLDTLMFVSEKELKQQSEQLCRDGKPVIENQIALFEHEQSKKSVDGVFGILDKRKKAMVDDEEAAKNMKEHLFRDMNLTYTIISYLPGEIKIFTPGMCIIQVKEERVYADKRAARNEIFIRHFIFSNLKDKWVLEGYYPEKVTFLKRYEGFFNK